MGLTDLSEFRSLPEYLDHQKDVRSQITALETEYKGQPFPEDVRPEYAELRKRDSDLDPIISELEARERYLSQIDSGATRRGVPDEIINSRDARGTSRERDLYDIATLRGGLMGGDSGEIRDRAMRVLDATRFAFGDADKNREHIEKLIELDAEGGLDGPPGSFAARMLTTGSPAYKQAFAAVTSGRSTAALTTHQRNALEQAKQVERALSLTQSGYAVPFQIDPTIIPISNGVLNPIRAISRVVQVTQNTWKGVTSAGITAAYGAQAVEASDNTPTLAQPSWECDKAFAFVPFSIEAGEDWGGLQAAMGQDFADAKDTLEATKFVTGAGHGSNEPLGFLALNSTGTATTAGSAVFAAPDLFTLTEALAERWQPNASIVASRTIFDKVRQFGTTTGYSYLVDLGPGLPSTLLGYPRYTLSTMSTSTGTGQKIMTIGDFRQFVIVDRIGLNVEYIPHLFGTANNYPSGQRGLYMYWRNTSGPTTKNAFVTLHVKDS
jgi:HK97 family phage major capsid protein